MNEVLHTKLLKAHECDDTATLSLLYAQAADESQGTGDTQAMFFFLTQAYIFALDSGLPVAADYNRRLAQHGRDVLQKDLTGSQLDTRQ